MALEVCVGVRCCLLVDDLVPRVICVDWQEVCVELEHVHGSLLSFGLDLVCGFLGLFDFRHKVSLQCWVSWTGLSSSHIGILGGLP